MKLKLLLFGTAGGELRDGAGQRRGAPQSRQRSVSFFLGALFLETCRVPLISHVYFFQGRSHKFQVLNRIFACYFWSSVESWRWCNWTVVVLPRLRSLPAAPRKAPPGAASAALRRRQQLCRARHQTGAAAGALLQRCHVDLVGGQPLAEKASPR